MPGPSPSHDFECRVDRGDKVMSHVHRCLLSQWSNLQLVKWCALPTLPKIHVVLFVCFFPGSLLELPVWQHLQLPADCNSASSRENLRNRVHLFCQL